MFRFILILAFVTTGSLTNGALINLNLPIPEFPVQVCLQSAVLNVDTGTCQCPVGQSGVGDLCCAEEGMDLCVIKGDPRITSFFNVSAYLNFPCTQRLTTIKNRVDDKDCTMDIVTAADFVQGGNLMDKKLRVEVNVNNQERKSFILQDGSYWDPDLNQLLSVSLSVKVFNILGIKITLSFDNDLRIWNLNGCGCRISFRTPVGAALVQAQVPGICIVSPKNAQVNSVNDGNICAMDNNYDPSPYHSKEQALLAVMLDLSLGVREAQDIDSDNIASSCSDVVSTFHGCDVTRKTGAIQTCSDILLDYFTRKCLFDMGAEVISVFADCVGAFCTRAVEPCARLRNSAAVNKCCKQASTCDTW